MELKKTAYARKIDAMGRIMIPVKLRNELQIQGGDIMHTYFLTDDDGARFICFKVPDAADEIEKARALLARYDASDRD